MLQKIISLTAIAIGSILAGIYSLPLYAQSNVTELENIETDDNLDWSFTSENKSRSLQDEIEALPEYGISESEAESDVQLIEESPKWGNKGDVEDYSIEFDFYEY